MINTIIPVTYTCTQASGSGYNLNITATLTATDATSLPQTATIAVTGSTSPPTVSVAKAGSERQPVCRDALFKEVAFSVTSSGTPTLVIEPSSCAAIAATGERGRGVVGGCSLFGAHRIARHARSTPQAALSGCSMTRAAAAAAACNFTLPLLRTQVASSSTARGPRGAGQPPARLM